MMMIVTCLRRPRRHSPGGQLVVDPEFVDDVLEVPALVGSEQEVDGVEADAVPHETRLIGRQLARLLL